MPSGGTTPAVGGSLAYAKITAPVTVTGTSGAQQSIVSAGAIAYAGDVWIKFSAPYAQLPSGTTVNMILTVWQNGAEVFRLIGFNNNAASTLNVPFERRAKLTIASGDTLEIRAWTSSGSPIIGAGNRGASNYDYAYVAVEKAV